MGGVEKEDTGMENLKMMDKGVVSEMDEKYNLRFYNHRPEDIWELRVRSVVWFIIGAGSVAVAYFIIDKLG